MVGAGGRSVGDIFPNHRKFAKSKLGYIRPVHVVDRDAVYPAVVGAVSCPHNRPYGPLITHGVVRNSNSLYTLCTVRTALRDPLIQPASSPIGFNLSRPCHRASHLSKPYPLPPVIATSLLYIIPSLNLLKYIRILQDSRILGSKWPGE